MFLNVSFNFATAISKYDTFSSYHIVRTRIAKVTNFFPFCPFRISIFSFLTIGISMYQNFFLPYFIIPSTFSPQASSPLSHHRQTEGQTNFKGCYLIKFFFFSLSARGPMYPQPQLLLGWPNYGVDGRLNGSRPRLSRQTLLAGSAAVVLQLSCRTHFCSADD
jgi:hypothetical protein